MYPSHAGHSTTLSVLKSVAFNPPTPPVTITSNASNLGVRSPLQQPNISQTLEAPGEDDTYQHIRTEDNFLDAQVFSSSLARQGSQTCFRQHDKKVLWEQARRSSFNSAVQRSCGAKGLVYPLQYLQIHPNRSTQQGRREVYKWSLKISEMDEIFALWHNPEIDLFVTRFPKFCLREGAVSPFWMHS